MTVQHLRAVEDNDPLITKPKFLAQISPDARLSEIFVYSQRDFSLGATAHELSRAYDPQKPAIPHHDDSNLIALKGEFSVTQIEAALDAMEAGESAEITALRATIVNEIDSKNLFYCVVATQEDANEHGIVFLDKYLSDKPVALGVMAFDP